MKSAALYLGLLAALLPPPPILAAGTAHARSPDAIVALDGSGQFTSVQAAISAAPMHTAAGAPRWLILVKPGTYHERVYVQRERGWIEVRGEDEATTVITFGLHANVSGPDGQPIGTFRTPTVQIDGDDMIWERITFANSAGPVAQALAVRVDADRVTFRHCRFLSWQDTILLNRGRQYLADCYIEGHVDFLFGGATAFFDRCHIHCLGDGYITAASTPAGAAYGFVFADCRITAAEGVKTYLGRPWRDYARTLFLRTQLSAAIRPEGWHNWNKPDAERTTFYAEHGSTGPGASPDTRVRWAHSLTSEDAELLTPAYVLTGADRWDPLADQAVASATAGSPSAPLGPPASGGPRLRLVLVGDSTVTDQNGWGAGFKQLLQPGTECLNAARNGRSSKSYRDEGHWAAALALKGDWYLIQFGHNDQPGKGADRETDPATTFAANLARYVDEVRAIGARPVLITSLVRRIFDPAQPGRLADTLEPYAEATRRVAREKGVPLVDLHARSLELCERWGPEKCESLNPVLPAGPDRTHLEGPGSLLFAGLVANELRRVAPEWAPVLTSAPAAP